MCDLDRRTFLAMAAGTGLGMVLAACESARPPEVAQTSAPPQAPPQAPTANLPAPGLRTPDPSEFRRPVLLKNVNIVDVTTGAVRERMDVRVADGKIQAIGAGLPAAEGSMVADLTGRYLMPGLISIHSHPGMMVGLRMDPNGQTPERMKQDLGVWLRFGVTTLQGLGTDRPFGFDVQREQRQALIGARFLSVGQGFGVAGGVPAFRMDPPAAVVRETEPGGIRRVLETSAERGASGVKIWYDTWWGQMPKMKPEVARTILEEAARVKLPVYAHVYAVDDAKLLIRSGLHAIAHMPRDREVDNELINLMLERNVPVIPTLAVAESAFIFVDRPSWVDDPLFGKFLPPGSREFLRQEAYLNTVRALKQFSSLRPDFERAMRNVGLLHRAGVRFGFGTDTGVANRVPGFYEHRELEMLVSAGVAPVDALRMATIGSAEVIGQRGTLGEIAPGRRADLVVLRANPLQNIRNTRTIESVWLEGVQACGAL
jgi:imidazolonepropionase-like amidohydrolase